MHYRCLRSSPVSGKIRAPAQAIVEIPLFLLLGLCVVVGLGRSQVERLGSSGDSVDPELCLGAALCLILDSRGSIGSSLCWFEICHMPDGLACLLAWLLGSSVVFCGFGSFSRCTGPFELRLGGSRAVASSRSLSYSRLQRLRLELFPVARNLSVWALLAWLVCGVLWVWVVLKVRSSVQAETRGIQFFVQK